MIYTYGGPLATTKNVTEGSLSSAGYLFNMYLAYRHGYVTATIDTRGMSGYGGHFEGANWEQPGKPQSEDLVDGVTFLVENHGVDPEKVGINGWSFGGFQAQYCLYAEPDVFKLGIAGAGPTEWQNYNTWYANIFIGDAPLGDPDTLDQYSLTKLAKNLKSPLLLLHGMEDTNVLFQDTIHVYRELLKAGKGPLVELVIDPTGGHGMGGDIKTRDRYEIYEAFLMKHWGSHRD
jgi:dipeptidyl aminopeptidase/acylaminoacyl peptidase